MRYRIGRAETNDIVINEPTVSREHAELIELGRGFYSIRDLGSSYGTSVRQGADWSLVTAAEVRRDTPLRIGEMETTVAELLRDIDPRAGRSGEGSAAPWATPDPRLSPRARARHPETTHITPDQLAELQALRAEVTAAKPLPAVKAKVPEHAIAANKGFSPWLIAGLAVAVAAALVALLVVLAR